LRPGRGRQACPKWTSGTLVPSRLGASGMRRPMLPARAAAIRRLLRGRAATGVAGPAPLWPSVVRAPLPAVGLVQCCRPPVVQGGGAARKFRPPAVAALRAEASATLPFPAAATARQAAEPLLGRAGTVGVGRIVAVAVLRRAAGAGEAGAAGEAVGASRALRPSSR
jgi:hypothetical protein